MATVSSQTFGDVLRRSRLAAGLTQEELADHAGLSVRGLSDLERGARRAPRRETIQLLAEALHLPAEERARLEAAARKSGTRVLATWVIRSKTSPSRRRKISFPCLQTQQGRCRIRHRQEHTYA